MSLSIDIFTSRQQHETEEVILQILSFTTDFDIQICNSNGRHGRQGVFNRTTYILCVVLRVCWYFSAPLAPVQPTLDENPLHPPLCLGSWRLTQR